ncbi:MAG: DUF3526 domain-containing protein [Duganella sp.]
MNKILTLVIYDLRALRRERGAVLLLAAALLLAAYGLFEGNRFRQHAAAAQQGAAAHEVAARRDAAALAARYFADPQSPQFDGELWYRTPVDVRGYAFRAHVGYAARPLLPGAALAIGQADLQPASVQVRAESMASVLTAAEIDHPARLAAGRYDLLYFVVYLWPLIVLALCASVLTQDRESLRLRSLLLQGVRSQHILFGQVAARGMLATGLLAGTVALLSLALGAVPASGAGMAALAWWMLVAIVYTLFWMTVAGVVCAVARDRMHAAFYGFGAWLLLAVVLPATVDVAARLAAPIPPREAYVRALRDAGDRVAANRVHSLARFYDSHPEWRPTRTRVGDVPASVSRLQRAEELDNAMAVVDDQYARAETRRAALSAQLAVLSPVTLANAALARIAGNDSARQHAFIAEVTTHQRALRAYFQQAIQQAALGDELHPCPRACLGGYGFRYFDEVPRFAPSPALAAQPAPAAGFWTLAAWGAAFLALAAAILRRARRHQV